MHFLRSLLFAPANRPDLICKFPRYDADGFVLDLEDGTPENDKAKARDSISAMILKLRQARLKGGLWVRVNGFETPHFQADLQAVLKAKPDGVIVPKLKNQNQLEVLKSALATKAPDIALLAGIESIIGVLQVTTIASFGPPLKALYFGAEDFISEMGGERTKEGLEVLYARSRVVLAAKSQGLLALDQVVVDIRDDALFKRDTQVARTMGYDGKICLLPRQVPLANQVFSPKPEEVDFSRRLIETYEKAQKEGKGVIEFEGKMVDAPLLKRTKTILAKAQAIADKAHG